MAMNPMQRRARNSFLIGFLVSLIIMAVVVLILLNKIKSINEAKEALEALQSTVYVASADLESGKILDFTTDFTMETVQTTVDNSTVISDMDFEFLDENGEIIEKVNEDGSPKKKQMVMKVNVPAGTIVTKDMIIEYGEETLDSDRIQEYNMIALPSKLKNGDYIDIRLTLPSGKDYIVLSKKQVLGTNATSIWLKVSEDEILILNNAIVDSYTITGSKLYATLYAEAGIQEASTATYMVSPDVMALILQDPNIVNEASQNIWNSYDTSYRTQVFETAIEKYRESQDSIVEGKNSAEIQAIKAARQSFVESLEGTEDIGYER